MFDKLKIKNINGKRHYLTPDGNAYPSMTTITGSMPLSQGLLDWRASVGEEVADWQMRMGGIRGDAMHKLCEEYLKGRDSAALKMEYPKLLPYALFENEIHVLDCIKDIKCQEGTLWTDEYKIAGRVDCVARFDSQEHGFSGMAIIDFKTSGKAKSEQDILIYFIQTTGYREMWRERTGEKIDHIVIIISCESGERQVFIKKADDYVEALRELAAKYHAEHPI